MALLENLYMLVWRLLRRCCGFCGTVDLRLSLVIRLLSKLVSWWLEGHMDMY